MRRSTRFPLLVALLVAIPTVARAGDTKPANLDQYNLPTDRVAIQGFSPVSYFTAGEPERGSPDHAVTYRGITYYLTSAEQVKLFNASPWKYEPAFGGWCAYGAAIEKKFPIDPASFKIVDGRLFLFLKNEKVDALPLWNKEDEKLWTQRADAWWKKIAAE